MAHNKTTSTRIAKKASKLLKGKKTSKNVKSVSGSALSQKHKKKM